MHTHFLLIVAIAIGRSSCQGIGKTYKDDLSTIQMPNLDLPVRHENSAQGCGYRQLDSVGSKIDIDEAEFGEFPWMIAILRGRNNYTCGGSLLTPKVVMTRAYWIHRVGGPPNQFSAIAGEWDSSGNVEQYPEQRRNVAEVVIHENFDNYTNLNDIALLVLDTPFNLDVHIKPICLAPRNSNFNSARCLSTGWGKENFGSRDIRTILKKIQLPVVSNAQCERNLRETRLGRYFELHPSFMCAGGERNKDMCIGDGGSPLVCQMPGETERYYQVGIVSWGIGCNSENVPGVYTSVSYMRTWIDQQLSRRNIDASSYIP